MNQLFIIQLITSFIIGGGAVALLSFFAEKVNKNIAGIILAFPVTLALGFFFLGWVASPEAVFNIVPTMLFPLGISLLFVTLYPHIANFFKNIIKNIKYQVIFTLLINVVVWFVLSILIIQFNINNILLGSLFYLCTLFVSHYVLNKKKVEKPIGLIYTPRQKIIRAISAGAVVFLVVLFSKILNPFWGGLLALFPIAFSIMIVIIHSQYGVKNLFPTLQKIPLGSLSLYFYAITAMITFPIFGFIMGTFISYLISILITLILIYIQNKLHT